MAPSNIKMPSPFQRLQQLLWEDKRDLGVLLMYTAVSSVLALLLPVASQALVNIIASGVFLQPLIVLAVVVLVGLLFMGLIRVVEMTLMEVLQQRLFVRVALHLGHHLPRIDMRELHGYPPELVNRFFDTMTIQKSLAKVLLVFPASIVQILVAMVFMGFYSPYFLMFNLLLIGAFVVFTLLGKNGVKTSLVESQYKYDMAHWLEDVARCQASFKVNSGLHYSIHKVDSLSTKYVGARRKHFNVIIRQITWEFLVTAIATAGLLALGGWLVMQGQITLGQLVAAELMTILILAAADKIVINLESWYDLLTGLAKLGYLTDLPAEKHEGVTYLPSSDGMEITLSSMDFKYPTQENKTFENLNLDFAPGTCTAIVGPSGAGKTTLAKMLLGLLTPDRGTIQVNRQHLSDIDIASFRKHSALVDSPNSIFNGTVKENILMGRDWISERQLLKALKLSNFEKVIEFLPNGLNTILESEGANLSSGKRQMLLLARAFAGEPDVLVLDEAFHNIDRPTRLRVLAHILNENNAWTVIMVTHDTDVVKFSDYVYMLSEGKLIGQGTPEQLVLEHNPEFDALFPNIERIDGEGRV